MLIPSNVEQQKADSCLRADFIFLNHNAVTRLSDILAHLPTLHFGSCNSPGQARSILLAAPLTWSTLFHSILRLRFL
jgi:hypothetical protein